MDKAQEDILRIIRDSYFVIPCKMRINEEDKEKFINVKVGDTVTTKGDIGMTPDILINNETQERVFPVFSQYEEIPKDYRKQFHYMKMHFTDVCELAKNYNVQAIVIDPFTVSFTLGEELQNIVLALPSIVDTE